VEATKLSFETEVELMMRQYWASAYGVEVEDLMGPFYNEPDGLPVEEGVYLGPYFEEDIPEIPDEEYSALIFQFSMSRFSGENPPGFGTFSLLMCGGTKDFKIYGGFYYGVGFKAGETDREGPTSFTESGIDIGFRGYLTPVDSRVGVYFVMGGLLSSISWSGTPTSEETDDGEVIIHEGSGEFPSYSAYAGLGATLLRAKAFQLGMITTYGTRNFDQEEMRDFEKKLFGESRTEFRLGVEVIVPF
jgi:hypothetical protein